MSDLPYPMLTLAPGADKLALLVAIRAAGWQFAQCSHATALGCLARHAYDRYDVLYLCDHRDGGGRRFWMTKSTYNHTPNHVHLNSWRQMQTYCLRMGARGPIATEYAD